MFLRFPDYKNLELFLLVLFYEIIKIVEFLRIFRLIFFDNMFSAENAEDSEYFTSFKKIPSFFRRVFIVFRASLP